jgi:exopolysaccharide biosynthesis WecB/TagA/CpsF family protein
MHKRIPILNIQVDNFTHQELLEEFKEGVLVTPNVDHLMILQEDREFYDLYRRAEYVAVDSRIVKNALKFLGTPIKEVIPGSDFFPFFYNFHKNDPETKIFLLGAKPGIAQQALEIINKKVGREIVVGALSPSFGFEANEVENQQIISVINRSSANVLLVGVGAPKQEKWIFRHKHQLPNIKMFLALGATIDFEAGNLKRAPRIFQLLALEWFYRLIKEPRRLWRRYLVHDLPFFYLILKQKLKTYRDPFAK